MAVQGDRVAPGVAAQEPGGAGVGPQQPEQDAQGGGLAGPVGAEEPVHFAGPHGQVQPVEGTGAPEPLLQRLDLDRGLSHCVLLASCLPCRLRRAGGHHRCCGPRPWGGIPRRLRHGWDLGWPDRGGARQVADVAVALMNWRMVRASSPVGPGEPGTAVDDGQGLGQPPAMLGHDAVLGRQTTSAGRSNRMPPAAAAAPAAAVAAQGLLVRRYRGSRARSCRSGHDPRRAGRSGARRFSHRPGRPTGNEA